MRAILNYILHSFFLWPFSDYYYRTLVLEDGSKQNCLLISWQTKGCKSWKCNSLQNSKPNFIIEWIIVVVLCFQQFTSTIRPLTSTQILVEITLCLPWRLLLENMFLFNISDNDVNKGRLKFIPWNSKKK